VVNLGGAALLILIRKIDFDDRPPFDGVEYLRKEFSHQLRRELDEEFERKLDEEDYRRAVEQAETFRSWKKRGSTVERLKSVSDNSERNPTLPELFSPAQVGLGKIESPH
jgi:hypothetical protein